MADDPRIGEALNVLWRFHDVGARKEDAEHLVEQIDVKDRLRDLLADEDRAVDLIAWWQWRDIRQNERAPGEVAGL